MELFYLVFAVANAMFGASSFDRGKIGWGVLHFAVAVFCIIQSITGVF